MKILLIAIFSLLSLKAHSQDNSLSIQEAIDQAIKNNRNLMAATLEVESQRQLRKTSFDLPKTDVTLLYGQYNSTKNENNITITQSIPFTAFGSQGSLNRSLIASSELKKAATENEIIYQVKQAFYQLAFVKARHDLLLQQDSLYEGFLKSASLRYKTGETNLLEQTTAQVQSNEIKNQLRINESEIIVLRSHLKTLLNTKSLPDIAGSSLVALQFNDIPDTNALTSNPSLAYMRQQIDVARSQKKVVAAKFAPELLVGFFSQTLIGTPNEDGSIANSRDRFTGFQVGLAIPLWFAPHQGRVKAAEFNKLAAQSNYEYYQISFQGQLQQASQQYTKNKSSLEYFNKSALPNADLILKQSQAAFRGGEIGYAEYLLSLRNAIGIKESYLKTLNDYNQSIFYIEYLSGNK